MNCTGSLSEPSCKSIMLINKTDLAKVDICGIETAFVVRCPVCNSLIEISVKSIPEDVLKIDYMPYMEF